jgi:hypothetical protein
MTRERSEREIGEAARAPGDGDAEARMAGMLGRRVRYCVDGVAVGSRRFVDGVFHGCRERFGAKRKTGARRLRGGASAAAGMLWSLRDFKKGIGDAPGLG